MKVPFRYYARAAFDVCIILLLLYVLVACVTDPKGPPEGERTAVLVEGLGDYPFLKNAYNKALEDKGYKVYNLTYKYPGPIAGTVCLGHSFGGGRLIRSDAKCEVVITMDAREWNASKNDSYVSGHARHFNYYQRSGLRGYPIKGAENIDMGFAGHLNLPRACFDKVMEIL